MSIFVEKKPVENCMKIEEKSKRRARSQRGLKKVAHTRSVHMANPISDIGYKGPSGSMASTKDTSKVNRDVNSFMKSLNLLLTLG